MTINTANCTHSVTQTVNINVKPTANFSLAPISGCPTLTVNFTNTSTSATSYDWDFGNGNTSSATNPINTFTNTTSSNKIYTISLIASTPAGCIDTFTSAVTVFTKPNVSFTVNAPAGCSPVAATFTNNSTGATNYNWSFGDLSSSTTTTPVLSHTYTNTSLLIQTFTAQLVAISSNGCKDSSSLVVTTYPRPIFNFSMVPNSGCSPLSINFPPVLGAVNYQWDFGDGSPLNFSPNPTHVFTNTTIINKTYTVQLIATNAFSCVDTAYGYPVVFAKPQANCAISTVLGCSPLATTFTNTSISGSTYLWKFGDGTTASTTNTNHTYTNLSNVSDQTFTCTLVAISSNGCRDSIDNFILTHFKPFANFVIDTPGCASKTITFTNISQGSFIDSWNFGDGSSLSSITNPIHTFTNNTISNLTFSVQLISTSTFGCKDTTFGYPQIYAKPIANFALTPSVSCSPLTSSMTNSSLLATSYLWKYGDGNTNVTFNTNHTYTNTSNTTNQSYNCTLLAINSNGCLDSLSKSVLVLFNPKANFAVDTPACSPKLLNFTNTSLGANSYNWDFGLNTSSNTNPSQAFTNTTTANITNTVQLIATSINNCKDTLVASIIVHPKPEFSIIASPDSGCSALTVNFPSINNVNSYQWNFGDGNIATTNNPSNVYYNNSQITKTFTVQLIGTDGYGCKDSSQKIIKVFAKPIALFQANPNLVYIPTNPVTCTNLSSGAVSYYWNFGDGNTSTEINPSYVYQEVGEYQIYLVAKNTHGCLDTFNLPSKIIAELESTIEIPNAFSPNPNAGNGGTFSSSDVNNDVFHPVLKGIDKYELNIFSRWGELLFVSKDITIGWDGYYKGKLCTQDIYIWKINATSLDGKKIAKTGDLLLLR